jgi:hypothetical protein
MTDPVTPEPTDPVDPVDPATPADPVEATRPEYIPEKFWDEEAKEIRTEGLAKSYAELERLRGKSADELKEEFKATFEEERLANRPEDPDKYTLPENEAFDPEALASSPVVSLWRKAAHEAGLGQEQFESVLNEYATSEVERMQAAQEAELAKLGDNAKDRTEAIGMWAKKTFGEGEEFGAIARVASDAAGVQALERIMKALSDSGVELGSEPAGTTQEDTLDDIRTLMGTKAYYSAADRDPAVVKRVEEFFKKQAQ